jgi:hypothetical protein
MSHTTYIDKNLRQIIIKATALRHRYYPESVLVGDAWGAEDDMILLNPQIVSPDGEWEAIFFANWIPGNQRYRSFRDFVEKSVNRLE